MKKILVLFIWLTWLCGSVYAINLKQVEENKQTVKLFYNEAINNKNFEAAEKYMGAVYIQHNPFAADGKEGFKQFIQYLKENFPQTHSEIKHIYAEGDFVILHVHSVREPGDRGNAVFDVFRLENGKIVEHWDAIQPIPASSANDNSMF